MNESNYICSTCKNGIFDPIWGEHKCRHFEIYIYDAFKKTECAHYEKSNGEKGE